MRTAIEVWLFLLALNVLIGLCNLGLTDYPRVVKHSRGMDALGIMVNIGLAVVLATMLGAP
jgi:hypothetical protein